MNKILKGFLGIALLTGAFVYAAPPANAGIACYINMCSRVKNHSESQRSLEVARDWGNTAPQSKSPKAFIRAGQTGPWKDTDGYRTDGLCRTYKLIVSGTSYAPKHTWISLARGQWIQVHDGQYHTLKINC